MNILIFSSYVFCSFDQQSPYFYNSEIDKLCLNEIKNSIIDLCNPVTSLGVDKKIKDTKKQVVFIEFIGWLNRYYSYFTKDRYEYKEFDKDITEENCQEIVDEIVDEIHRICKITDFDIYFTIDKDSENKNHFFNKDKLYNSIELLKSCFKRKLQENSVAKYYPIGYINNLKSENLSVCFSNVRLSTLGNSEIDYFVFLDDSFYKKLFQRLELSIMNYEQEFMNQMMESYEFKDKQAAEVFLLYIFLKMHDNLKDNISNSQAILLLMTWNILTSKEGFLSFFKNSFVGQITKSEEIVLNEMLHKFFQEYNDFKTFDVFWDPLSNSKLPFSIDNCYSFMNVLSKSDSVESKLNEYSRKIISKVYNILTRNFKKLEAFILSSNQLERRKIEVLRYEIFNLYKEYAKEMIYNYVKYMEGDSSHKEESYYFEKLTKKCLKGFSKKEMKDITIFKKINDDNFREYIAVIKRS